MIVTMWTRLIIFEENVTKVLDKMAPISVSEKKGLKLDFRRGQKCNEKSHNRRGYTQPSFLVSGLLLFLVLICCYVIGIY